MNHILMVVNPEKPEAAKVAAAFAVSCASAGLTVSESVTSPDVVVAIGGDGTVLGAAAQAIAMDVPVAGINVGRVGYLAEFEPTDIGALIDAIVDDRFHVLRRGTVGVAVGDVSGFGVNDVVVEKVMSERIIEVAVTVDGEPLATYRTDGMIAATPLGSTAYSLSAGGPIVSPEVGALILTPVAPHSLLSRAIVLAPTATIEIALVGERSAAINIDGHQLTTVTADDPPIVISKGEKDVRFLSLGDHPFPHAVREQFGLDHA